MRINMVMSNEVYSKIFTAIYDGFFRKYASEHEIYITAKPLDNMDIYHYHRPHLETELKSNSCVTVHHDLKSIDPWLDTEKFLYIYSQAKYIICLNFTQQQFLHKHNINKTIIIPHGVDVNNFNKDNYENRNKLSIGIISKFYGNRVKGEAYLLELIKRLNNEKVKFYLLGENRYLTYNMITKYGFECVSFEHLPYFMFNEFYNNLDTLLITSVYEGGPANVPEAIAKGVPIIGRNIAMIRDYIKNGVNGYILTEEPDIDADMINNLAENREKLLPIRENINNLKVLDWSEVVEKHIELYNKIIKENK